MNGEDNDLALRPVKLEKETRPKIRRWLGLARAGAVLKDRTEDPGHVTIDTQFEPERNGARLRLPSAYATTFVLFVLAPSLAIIGYLAFIASDQYVSEAHFAVQSALSIASGGDSMKTQVPVSASGLPDLTTNDAYIVRSYMDSPAIIRDLQDKIDVRGIYMRPEADFWARLKKDASNEELAAYWKSKVETFIDGTSGIITLRVRAFRPDDAENLANAIIASSETLANEVSARARQSVMEQAQSEVERSEDRVKQALADLRAFRDKRGFIDPIASAASTSALLLGAMSQKITLESNYNVALKAMSPEAPTVVGLKAKLDEVDNQIVKLKAELTGNSSQDNTISASLVEFESLELRKEFAVKVNQLAEEALERAKQRAEQQNIFVSTFVPPALPQQASYPQRLQLSLLIPVGLAMFWGIFALFGASIEDHRY